MKHKFFILIILLFLSKIILSQEFELEPITSDTSSYWFRNSRSVFFSKNYIQLLYNNKDNNTLLYADNKNGFFSTKIIEELDKPAYIGDYIIKTDSNNITHLLYTKWYKEYNDNYEITNLNCQLIYRNNYYNNFDSVQTIINDSVSIDKFDFAIDRKQKIHICYLQSNSPDDPEAPHSLYYINDFDPPSLVEENLYMSHEDVYVEISDSTVNLFTISEKREPEWQLCLMHWSNNGSGFQKNIIDCDNNGISRLNIDKDLNNYIHLIYQSGNTFKYLNDKSGSFLNTNAVIALSNCGFSYSDIINGLSLAHIIYWDKNCNTGNWDMIYFNPSFLNDTIHLFTLKDPCPVSISIDSSGYLYGVLYVTLPDKNKQICIFKSNFKIDPSPPIIGKNYFCKDDPIILFAEGNNIKWYDDSLLTNLISAANSILIDTLPTILDRYYVTQTVKGIESRPVPFNYTILENHVTNLTERICMNDNFVIGEKSFKTAGEYSVILSDQYGCDSIVNLNLSIDPLPLVDIGPDRIIDENDTILLASKGLFRSYLWSTNEKKPMLTIIGADIDKGKHEYWLQVVDYHNCVNSDTVIITKNSTTNINGIISNSQIKLYPNPTKDYLNIEIYNIDENIQIDIISENGILMLTKNYKGVLNITDKFDLKEFKSGWYIIRIQTESEVRTEKFLFIK